MPLSQDRRKNVPQKPTHKHFTFTSQSSPHNIFLCPLTIQEGKTASLSLNKSSNWKSNTSRMGFASRYSALLTKASRSKSRSVILQFWREVDDAGRGTETSEGGCEGHLGRHRDA